MSNPFSFIVNLPVPYACYVAQGGRAEKVLWALSRDPDIRVVAVSSGTPPLLWCAGTGGIASLTAGHDTLSLSIFLLKLQTSQELKHFQLSMNLLQVLLSWTIS